MEIEATAPTKATDKLKEHGLAAVKVTLTTGQPAWRVFPADNSGNPHGTPIGVFPGLDTAIRTFEEEGWPNTGGTITKPITTAEDLKAEYPTKKRKVKPGTAMLAVVRLFNRYATVTATMASSAAEEAGASRSSASVALGTLVKTDVIKRVGTGKYRKTSSDAVSAEIDRLKRFIRGERPTTKKKKAIEPPTEPTPTTNAVAATLQGIALWTVVGHLADGTEVFSDGDDGLWEVQITTTKL